RWSFVVDAGMDAATGKRRQVRRTGFLTRKAALEELSEIVGDKGTLPRAAPSRQTIGSFAADWLETVRPSLKPSTWSGYNQKLRAHVIPKIGAIPMRSVTPGLLTAHYGQLLESGNRRGNVSGGPLSARTVLHVHKILHRMFADA
ncbi:MAG: hypothetical protein EXQ69_01860, partial [Acidimicrobiia bacterium]|nr:hypothetical protein [Acidimicrobiia bacterium]